MNIQKTQISPLFTLSITEINQEMSGGSLLVAI